MSNVCRHLRVPLDKDGTMRVRKGHGYRCEVDLPTPVLPASVTLAHGWHWPPQRMSVSIDECAKCPLKTG
jgi:hypothetical protein